MSKSGATTSMFNNLKETGAGRWKLERNWKETGVGRWKLERNLPEAWNRRRLLCCPARCRRLRWRIDGRDFAAALLVVVTSNLEWNSRLNLGICRWRIDRRDSEEEDSTYLSRLRGRRQLECRRLCCCPARRRRHCQARMDRRSPMEVKCGCGENGDERKSSCWPIDSFRGYEQGKTSSSTPMWDSNVKLI
ncbi:hypothetical protein LXL04_038675 [Taraxacum kok-saghyz]